jgi:hypothetical protein
LSHFNRLELNSHLIGTGGLSPKIRYFAVQTARLFAANALPPCSPSLNFSHRIVERTAVSWEDGGLLPAKARSWP